jgi:hypothetical protein
MKTILHIIKNWNEVNPVIQLLIYAAAASGSIALLCWLKGI